MKEIPPLAGWPTQTSFVRAKKVLEKKKRFRSSKGKLFKRK
jgi:hypothetical protein